MVYLTGDTHGDIQRFKQGKLRWLGKKDTVVVLGDFGFVWDGSAAEYRALAATCTMCAGAACWSWRARPISASVVRKVRIRTTGSRA